MFGLMLLCFTFGLITAIALLLHPGIKLGTEGGDGRGVFRLGGNIGQFPRVRLQVVQIPFLMATIPYTLLG